MNSFVLPSRKKIVLLMFTSLISIAITAQQDKSNPSGDFWKNVRFGGGIGLSFGDGYFSGTIAPSAIYEFTDYFAAGIGLNAIYVKRNNLYKSTIFGGSVLSLFHPIEELQLSAEFEELNVDRDFDEAFVTNPDDNYWYSALFLGIGYRTGNITLGLRYDVLYDDDKSIYTDPWMPFVRVYF